METFEQMWESTRTNSWSWAYPSVLVLSVVVIIALSRIKKKTVRQISKVIASLVLSVVAIQASNLEIQKKWELREIWAESHPDQMTEANRHALTVDGANRSLGPVYYGFLALLLMIGTSVVMWILRVFLESE